MRQDPGAGGGRASAGAPAGSLDELKRIADNMEESLRAVRCRIEEMEAQSPDPPPPLLDAKLPRA